MRRVLLLLPLLFAGCSCQPEPVVIDPPGAATTDSVTEAAPPAAGTGAETPTLVPEASAVSPGALDETSTVHQYVVALLNQDRSIADAYWTGGRPAPRPDDTVLREIPELRSLRVKTRTTVARDAEQPSRLLEVPVQIRAVTADGALTFEGWYRLQPRPDGSSWEIQSASIHPVLK